MAVDSKMPSHIEKCPNPLPPPSVPQAAQQGSDRPDVLQGKQRSPQLRGPVLSGERERELVQG